LALGRVVSGQVAGGNAKDGWNTLGKRNTSDQNETDFSNISSQSYYRLRVLRCELWDCRFVINRPPALATAARMAWVAQQMISISLPNFL
jgi:hypothetical protein